MRSQRSAFSAICPDPDDTDNHTCQRRQPRMVAAVLPALIAGTAALAAAPAQAEELVDLPPPPMVGTTTTTTVVTTTRPGPAQVAPQQQQQQPQVPGYAPPGYGPPPPPPPGYGPPPGSVSGPMYYNGPVWVIPAPVTGQPVAPPPPAYAPPPPPRLQYGPALPPPPMVMPPPRTASCCFAPPTLRGYKRPPRGPVFSIGLRFTTLGINQQVFGQNMEMYGGGLQLRFRTQGHWGFETAFDILRADVGQGAFVRNAYPFTFSAMLYLFKNRPENHFNIYAVAGVGLMADDVTLYGRQDLNQQFLEFMGHAGGGVELRFSRLALSADIRAIGLALDDSGPAGVYYQGIAGGPVPSSSYGYKANIGAHMWF